MLVLWMLACSDRELSLVRPQPPAAEPDIRVEPNRVSFEPLAVGCAAQRSVTIRNVGEGPLDVAGTWVDFLDETSRDFTVERLEGVVRPGEDEVISLQFQPSFVWDAAAELVVDSDDPDEPQVRLPIGGGSFDPTWNLDVFEQAPQGIDVLWVIDNSGSMWEERDRVTTEIRRFFQWFIQLDLDWQMGVITTDVVNPAYSGQLVGHPPYVTSSTEDAEATLARSIQVGGAEMGDEAGLHAMELALTEPLLSGVNEGFYRPEARLAVIFLTDEDDQGAHGADWYIRFLEGLKPDPADVFVAAIVGDAEEGCSGTCVDGASDARAGDRYLEVAAAFGGFHESICTCDLAPALERMGFESTWYVRAFPLSERPGAASMLTVWVDGVEAGGWSYDPVPNAVVFDEAPPLGAQVVARYPVRDPCGE